MFGPVLDTKNSIPRCTCQKELLSVPLTHPPLHRPSGFSLLRHRALIYKLQTFILAQKVRRLNERLFAFLRFIAIIKDLRLTRPPRSVTKTAWRVIFSFQTRLLYPTRLRWSFVAYLKANWQHFRKRYLTPGSETFSNNLLIGVCLMSAPKAIRNLKFGVLKEGSKVLPTG